MKFVFAGDRQISCDILRHLIKTGHKPMALLVSAGSNESHAEELIAISQLDSSLVFRGSKFRDDDAIIRLKEMELDYIIGIHFPYIIPGEVLNIPNIGFLNLHPAYLPYNKGWHTPTWAIIDQTPYGATLHFMSEKLDEGDIIHQLQLEISPTDTANSLYQKVLRLEKQVFYEALPKLVSLNPPRTPQTSSGTSYKKKDLHAIQEVALEEKVKVKDFINLLRALRTNNVLELPYYYIGEKKIGLKIDFEELN